MANLAPTKNRIRLIVRGRYDEGVANGVILPGHLIQTDASGKVIVNNTPGANAELMFATEDALQGKTILGGYPLLNPLTGLSGYQALDIVPYVRAIAGDVLFGRLQKGQNVAVNDPLMSAGDGTFMKNISGLGGKLYTAVAPSTVLTNTAVATLYSTQFSLPANFLQVGDVIGIKAQVAIPAKNGADTLALQLQIGAAPIALIAAYNPAVADIVYFDTITTVRTIGNAAAGTITSTGVDSAGVIGTATAKPIYTASAALDTTIANIIGILGTYNNANAGNQSLVQEFVITIQRAGGFVSLAYAIDAINNTVGDATVNSTQGTDEFITIRVIG